MIAQCLQRLNVTFGDTRDEWGHQRFIPYKIEEFYSNEGPNMNFIHDADFYPFEKVSSLLKFMGNISGFFKSLGIQLLFNQADQLPLRLRLRNANVWISPLSSEYCQRHRRLLTLKHLVNHAWVRALPFGWQRTKGQVNHEKHFWDFFPVKRKSSSTSFKDLIWIFMSFLSVMIDLWLLKNDKDHLPL